MNSFKIFRRSNFGTLWLLAWISLAGWFCFGQQLYRDHPSKALGRRKGAGAEKGSGLNGTAEVADNDVGAQR